MTIHMRLERLGNKLNALNDDIKLAINNYIIRMFDGSGVHLDNITKLDLLDDLGLDSIKFISMIVDFEKIFNITIPDEKLHLDNFRTVDRICETIREEMEKTL